MTVDVRAKVFCNLGTVIQGSLADEALSAGQGLITCRGQVVLNGLSTPAVGSTVNFGWVRGSTIARIPRTLRVLSSFADPFRGTTTVQLGDKLVYLANLRGKKAQEEEPDGTNGPDPASYPTSDYDYDTPNACYLPKEGAKPFNFSTPDAASKLTVREEYALAPAKVMGRAPMGLYASSVLSKCCAALGLGFTGQSLTNVYQDDFDLSAGYVQVIDQLLSSESLFGYLTENETLQIVTIDGYGSGPLITTDELIDLSGINQGILPGQTVSVTFDYKRLKDTAAQEAQQELDDEEAAQQVLDDPTSTPEEEAAAQEELDALAAAERERNWEEDISVTYNQEYTFTVEDGEGATVYSATFSHNPTTTTTTKYDESNYATLRRSVEKRIVASEVGTILQAVINAKYEAGDIGGAQTGTNDSILRQQAEDDLEFTTEETFEYEVVKEEATSEPQALPPDKLCPDPAGTERVVDEDAKKPKQVEKRQIKSTVTRYEPLCSLLAKMNVSGYDFSEYDLNSLPTAPYVSEQTITYYDTNQPTGQTKTRVDRYLAYAITLDGQQYIAEKGTNVTTDNQLSALLQQAQQLVFSHTEVSIQRDRTFGVQQRPSKEQLQADAKEKDLPVGGGNDKGEQQVDLEQENSTVETSPKTEVALPRASDDAVVWTASNGYEFKGSNAASMAMRYARTINALLRGNRAGVSLQLAATGMPLYPLSSVYLQAGGLIASYKSNGMSWSFNSDGVLCAMDALFVSGISGTGTRWFPVAPGITTLPSNPAVTSNSAAPANSATTPGGFNPAAPGSIFNSLPSGQAPVYAQSIAPSSGVPVVIETLPVVAGTRSIVSVLDRDYALTLPTGTAVLVTKAKVQVATLLAAAVGAFTATGQAAGRSYTRRLQAAARSFASTGYSAGSVRSYGIGTNAGTFALTGRDAVVKRVLAPLSADTGSFALTGQNATSSGATTLLAAVGAYSFSGQSAGKLQSAVLRADAGGFVLTGQPASLDLLTSQVAIATYTGNGTTSNAITGLGFEPGFVHVKRYDTASAHAAFTKNTSPYSDAAHYRHPLNGQNADTTSTSPYFITFDSDGFTLKDTAYNVNSGTYRAFCFKKGSGPATNTDGSITTQVDVNETLGMSQFTFTPSANNATIGHGLGAAPELVIMRQFSGGAYFQVGGTLIGNNYLMALNTNAVRSLVSTGYQAFSSTTISIGSNAQINSGSRAVGWAFVSKPGYSKLGTYAGSNSTVTVNLGFQPRIVLTKTVIGSTSNWAWYFSPTGSTGNPLFLNLNDTAVGGTSATFAFTSNGFTATAGGAANVNNSTTYLYMAFK